MYTDYRQAHRRFISPAAIEHFNLPWEWDPVCETPDLYTEI